jgi:signal transduction histidine kinase
MAVDTRPESLLAIAKLVAGRADEETVFGTVAERAAHDLGVDAAAVLRYVGGERAVVVGAWREGGPRGMPVNAELDFDARNSALGRIRATRRPARAESYEGSRGELPIVMQAAGLRSSVAAPVMVGGEAWGAVVASTTREEPFDPGAEERLCEFAELVGFAVAGGDADRSLARTRAELLAGADEARRQLERDLHAGPQQHLAAVAVTLRLARTTAGADTELGRQLDAALAEVVEAKASLEEIGRGVHPKVLSERGLAAAVLALSARSPLPVSLRELPGRRFAPTIEATAYFVVSEALGNAAEHAGATDVSVVVGDRGDRLEVEVRDDGRGGADPQAGTGLRALAQRVDAVDGRMEVESPAGGGTIVRAVLPA